MDNMSTLTTFGSVPSKMHIKMSRNIIRLVSVLVLYLCYTYNFYEEHYKTRWWFCVFDLSRRNAHTCTSQTNYLSLASITTVIDNQGLAKSMVDLRLLGNIIVMNQFVVKVWLQASPFS